MSARAFVGTSGFVYPHWRERFYPADLPLTEWLWYYTEHFRTAELNNSFYRLPSEQAFVAWRNAVPDDFVFAVKASRFLTHLKRLRDPEAPLDLLLHRARHLEDALGPVLFQLPARFHADAERLDQFLLALSRQRGGKGLRASLEVRHVSWLEPTILERLARANVALCLHDWHECAVTGGLTADFVYVRRHGATSRYGGSYTARALARDARAIRGWMAEGRDVYAYFNNDIGGMAVKNALELQTHLG
jgi:uncharacterized protein YecE (DUF72 family)